MSESNDNNIIAFNAGKVSKYGVFSGPYSDTFDAVVFVWRIPSNVICIVEKCSSFNKKKAIINFYSLKLFEADAVRYSSK